MHLASLEQSRELMRYMNSLNEWLSNDVEDRQAELRGVSARIDQLRSDLNRLGMYPTLLICTLIHSHLVPPPFSVFARESCRQVVTLHRLLLRAHTLSLSVV